MFLNFFQCLNSSEHFWIDSVNCFRKVRGLNIDYPTDTKLSLRVIAVQCQPD